MKATVTSKGQITIPLKIRQQLGITQGTVLEFEPGTEWLKARKAVDEKRMKSVIGIGMDELAGKSATEWLEDLRGPAELPSRRKSK